MRSCSGTKPAKHAEKRKKGLSALFVTCRIQWSSAGRYLERVMGITYDNQPFD